MFYFHTRDMEGVYERIMETYNELIGVANTQQ